MRKLIDAAAFFSLLAACGSVGNSAPAAALGPDEGAGGTEPEFVELGLDQFRSPFTNETVLKLNAIVGRSLAAVKEYDGAINEIQRSIDAARAAGAPDSARAEAKDGLARVARLSDEAKSARDDLRAAEAGLKASGEKYNEVILAGMTAFVVKVDEELRTATKTLSVRLSAE